MRKKIIVFGMTIFLLVMQMKTAVIAETITKDDVVGIWNGYYQVDSTYESGTLVIHEIDVDGTINNAILYTYAQNDINGDGGSYLMRGAVDLLTGDITLYGNGWLDRYSGGSYYTIEGRVEAGRISGTGFNFVRDKTDYHFDQMIGEWKGWYTNSSGVMDLDLYFNTISETGYMSDSVYIFNPSLGNEGGKSGSYEIRGYINPITKEIIMEGTVWIDRPSGYIFMNLMGNYNEDTLSGVASTSRPYNNARYTFGVQQITEKRNLDGFGDIYENISNITGMEEKIAFIESHVESLVQDQLASPDQIEEITDMVEFAVSDYGKINGVISDYTVRISDSDVIESLTRMDAFEEAVMNSLSGSGISLNRNLQQEVLIDAPLDGEILQIEVAGDVQGIDFQNITINTGKVSIGMDKEMLSAFEGDTVISIQSLGYYTQESLGETSAVVMDTDYGVHEPALGPYHNTRLVGSSRVEKFDIQIRDNKEEKPLVIGLSSTSDDKDYDCVFKEENGMSEALGGFYDKKTDTTKVITGKSATYYVKDNRKYFYDITYLDADTKKAIGVLTAKGMINGKSEEEFDPSASISRAEFTKIIIKGLYLMDTNAENPFLDVSDTAWYMPYVASSKKAGLINGYVDGTFKPNNIITKQEMVKICAASLHEKMGFSYPGSTGAYISHYKDPIVGWVEAYLALAEREGLIVNTSDDIFDGEKGMTRADAAIMLYRVFKRL